jgi:hypothetical protein
MAPMAVKQQFDEGGTARVAFGQIGGGFGAGGGPLMRFAVAEKDEKHVLADAVINGPGVIVSIAKVAKPVAVHYA